MIEYIKTRVFTSGKEKKSDINPVNCADDCKNKKIKNTEFDLSYLKLIFERNIINSIKKLYFFDLE